MEHTHHHNLTSKEESIALLKYMASHNASHTKELEKVAKMQEDNDEVNVLLNEAIESYEKGNALLCDALKKLGVEE